MPTCPRCHDQYTDDIGACASCGVALVADDAEMPAQVDRLLGTFHPLLAERVAALLTRRGIAHEALPAGEDRVEVVVDREFRDDLRAELAVNWDGFLARLDPEDRARVIGTGSHQPGWFDAPTSAWVDREGRLQVDAGTDADDLDSVRLWGPSLVAIGAVVGLFGWYGQGSGGLLVLGICLVGLGLFIPR